MKLAPHVTPKRLIVGISGASGAEIGIQLLQAMQRQPEWETHLVISEGARQTIRLETAYSVEQVEALATYCHPLGDISAGIASGTFKTEGMVVAPCSMKTVAGIAHGYSQNLLLRAADVVIKERRKLVLVARESPLSTVHLNNLLILANAGVVILLSWVATSFGLPWPAWTGIAVVAGLLAYEHSLVHANDLSKLNAAFFAVNGYISILFLLFWGAAVAVWHV